jgi:hypothetical protein
MLIFFTVAVLILFLFYAWKKSGENIRLGNDIQAKVANARSRLSYDQSPDAIKLFMDASRDFYAWKEFGPEGPESLRIDPSSSFQYEKRISNDLRESLPSKPSADIQKEILQSIVNSVDGTATLSEIMLKVGASASQIINVLDDLMVQDIITVGNRPDGAICYKRQLP